MDNLEKIKNVATRYNVTTSTLRYYEKWDCFQVAVAIILVIVYMMRRRWFVCAKY